MRTFYITGETQGFNIFNGGKNNGNLTSKSWFSFNGFCNGSDVELIGKQPPDTTALTLTYGILHER